MRSSILKKSVILFLTLVLLSLFIIITIPASTDDFIFVDDNAEPSWYDETRVRTIQEAINNASIGAEIFVYNGTYIENIEINKTVSIFGESVANVIISNATWGDTISVMSSGVIIQNLTIADNPSGDGAGSGIYDESSNSIYRNLHLMNNTYGIQLSYLSYDATITKNFIQNNSVGIIYWDDSNLVYNNYFDNIQNSEIHTEGEINNNWNITKKPGINIIGGANIGGNFWSDYTGMDLDGDGIGESDYFVDDSDFFIDYLPLTFPKYQLYVDDNAESSWYDETHVRTIQEAINNASIGAEIFVYNGTYASDITVDRTLRITGESVDNVWVYGSFYVNSIGVLIEKVTIANVSEGDFPSGIYDESLNSIYRNLHLLNNTYGIQLSDISYGITITENLFEENNYGIYSNNGSHVNITNNIFKNNTFGFLIDSSQFYTISHNIIIDNTGVGFSLISSNNNLIYDNFFDNSFNVDLDGGINNLWNDSKKIGINIIGGPYLGGNFWSDYTGMDLDGDGIGESDYFVDDSDFFIDYLPLTDNINLPPMLGDPEPGDGSTKNPLELDWSIQINDSEYGVFNWNITCSNGQYNYLFDSSNGTKTLHLSSLSYGTTYTIWVNVFDYYRWTNETFTFTTKGKNIIMNIPPVAIIEEVFVGFPGESINFDGSQSYDPDGYITSYKWDLDNGTVLEGKNINHSYSKHGNYNVTLTVFDNKGANNTTSSNVIIIKANNPPELDLILENSSGELTVNLTITVVDKDGDNINCIVNWGDNSSSTILQLTSNQTITETNTYTSYGTYVIHVTVNDGSTITSETKFLTISSDNNQEEKNDQKGNMRSNVFIDIITNKEPFDEPFLDNQIDSRSILGDHLDKNCTKIIATILSIIILFILNYLIEFFSDYSSERTIEYRKNRKSRFNPKKSMVVPPSKYLSMKEISAIIISTLILSFVLTWTWGPDLSIFWETFIIFLLVVVIIIFIREGLRAFLCSKLKFLSDYYIWPLGAIMMFVSTAIGNTFSLVSNHHYDKGDVKRYGKVSFIVSIVLYVIVAIAFLINLFYPSTILQMIIIVTILNLFIDLFPLNPMDGYEIRHWNIFLWSTLYIIVFISYIIVYFNIYP